MVQQKHCLFMLAAALLGTVVAAPLYAGPPSVVVLDEEELTKVVLNAPGLR